MQSPRLVGRERELRLVGETLARAGRGVTVLVLRGEPGVGTTRLLDEACTRAAARGLLVTRAATSPLEADIGYAVLLGLLRPLLLEGPAGARAALVEDLPALASVVPGLSAGTPSSEDHDLDRLRVGEAVREVLARLTRRRLLLLAVDDVEDADPASMRALAYAVRADPGLRVALVLTAHGADGVVRTLRSLPGSVVHEVRPLGEHKVREILGDLLGEEAPQAVADHVVTRAEGSPLLVRAVTGSLLASGALVRGNGEWTLREGAEREDPPELEEMTRRRLDRLDAPSKRTIGLLALAGGRLEHVALVRALRELEPDHDPDDTVARVAATPIVVDETTPHLTYRLLHPVVVSVAVARHSPLERCRAHAALARALADRGDTDRPALQAALAGDQLDDAWALDVLLRALRAALDRGAGAIAVRHAEAGLQRLEALSLDADPTPDAAVSAGADAGTRPARERALHLELLRGRALGLELEGRADDAVAAWAHVAESCGQDAVEGYLEAVLHLTHLRADGGHLHEAVAGVERLRSDPRWTRAEPGLRVPVLDLALGVENRLGRDGDDLLAELAEAAERSGSRAHRQRATMRRLQGLIERGDLAGVAAIVEGADLDDPELRRGRSLFVMEWGDPREALRLLDDGLATHVDDALPVVTMRLSEIRALALERCDLLDDVLESAAHVRGLAERLGSRRGLMYASIARGIVHVRRGAVDLARAELTAARTAYPPVGGLDTHTGGYADLLQGLLDLASGRPEAVVTRARRTRQGSFHFPREANLVLGEALSRTGALEVLDDLVDTLRQHVLGLPTGPALVDRLAGWSARDHGDATRASALLRSSAEQLTGLGRRREAASAWLDWAEVTDPQEASAQVGAALVELEALGCGPEARRARRLLRRTTNHQPRRRTGDLTERELEVARLVADGLSDADIARRLVVSPRTVTTHLQHAYRRLGLPGRTALARYVLEHPDT